MNASSHVYVDELFDAEDTEAITRAVYTWNTALNGVREYDVRPTSMSMADMQDPKGVLVLLVTSTCTFIPSVRNHPESSPLAWADAIGGRVVWMVRDRMLPGWVEPIARHELGHILGANDREGPGLMHWSAIIHELRCIDDATVLEVENWMHLAHGSLRGGCG